MTKNDTIATILLLAAESDEKALGRMTKANLEAMLAELEAAESDALDAADAKRMSSILNRYKAGYVVSKAASGRASLHNGDALAMALAALLPVDVAHLAERLLDCPPLFVGDGTGKYDGLNQGQIRMNSGNRIRAAIKRGDITTDSVLETLGVAA